MGIEIRSPKSDHEWANYFDLRYRVLRQPLNQPIGSERNDGDANGIHFALFENDILLAIARLDPTDTATVYQVRFVAVEFNQQKKGFGKLIMNACEEEALKLGGTEIILHARDYAVEFYKSLNYDLIEKSYLLFGQLQHFLMLKKLNNSQSKLEK